MRNRKILLHILCALLCLSITDAMRADEAATKKRPSVETLLAAIKSADPKGAEDRVVRDSAGKVIELKLSVRTLNKEVVTELRNARDLEALTVGCCIISIGKDLAPSLGELPRLKALRMLGCGADALPKLPPKSLGKLRTLFISYQVVTPDIAGAIAALPNLEELEIQSQRKLTATNLAPLVDCPKLKSLNLSGSEGGEDLVDILVQMKGTLKSVDLRRTNVSQESLQQLRDAGISVRTK